MTRTLAAALVALAALLPLPAAPPVTAHTDAGFAVDYDVHVEATHVAVIGTVRNHTATRTAATTVTAEFLGTHGEVLAAQSAPVAVTNLAPHATSPFAVLEPDRAAAGFSSVRVTASGAPTSVSPSGGLLIGAGSLAGDVFSVPIRNQSAVDALDVTVHGLRRDGATFTAIAASNPVDLAPGAQATVQLGFGGSGTQIVALVARSNAGLFVTSWGNYFNDLGTSDFVGDIAWMAGAGVTRGCSAHRFCPKETVTREQMAVFIARALDLPTAINRHPFTDIDDSPAQGQIASVWDFAITTGCTPTLFCPDDPVTREQMAAFLDRAYEFEINPNDFFTDDEASFAEPEINRAAGAGVTTGCSPTTYCPKATVTREQMAAFIHRAER
jgi:hypothetical protein